jgi:hypothetical protein
MTRGSLRATVSHATHGPDINPVKQSIRPANRKTYANTVAWWRKGGPRCLRKSNRETIEHLAALAAGRKFRQLRQSRQSAPCGVVVRRARHRPARRRRCLGGEPGRAPDGARGRPGCSPPTTMALGPNMSRWQGTIAASGSGISRRVLCWMRKGWSPDRHRCVRRSFRG